MFYLYFSFMKHLIQIWIITFIVWVLAIDFSFWLRIGPYPDYVFTWDSTPMVDTWEVESISQWSHTFSEKLWWILHLPRKDDYTSRLWYLTSLIQISVNWLLWILAFVVLVYMLYCGFLVLFSWSDDKNASKGKKWIANAAITLAGIGLSWLIISVMIWFINLIANADI